MLSLGTRVKVTPFADLCGQVEPPFEATIIENKNAERNGPETGWYIVLGDFGRVEEVLCKIVEATS